MPEARSAPAIAAHAGRSTAAAALAAAAFAAACLAAYFSYRLGLPGDFQFDDYPNLKLLGNHGGVHDLETLKLYLADAFAGPSGRPLAMLSFLLDARDWPAAAAPFKHTNILLHIINGLLLFVALSMALAQSGRMAQVGRQRWIAAIAAAWWLLSPYQVSSVLYVVQRMAELSASFVLVGSIGYLYGRRRLALAPRGGYLILSLLVPLATLAAMLSKENGGLLPLLLLVLEFTLLAGTARRLRPARWWLTLFLGLPTLAIAAFLLVQVLTPDSSMLAYRGFTLLERLLTESRVLMEYLWYLIVPHPQTPGLFRDNIVLSTSLLQPPSTLWSVAAIVLLGAIAVGFRRRLPLLSAAIAFFFAGHLLESTLLPLELAFEHRNYLPSMLLFLPLAQLLVSAYQASPLPSALVGLLVFALLTTTLAAHAELWSDRAMLYRTWALTNPDSPRAQLSYTNTLENRGQRQRALDHLAAACRKLPDNLTLELHLLRLQSSDPRLVDHTRFDRLAQRVETAPFSHEAVVAASAMTDELLNGTASGLSAEELVRLWQAFQANPNPVLQQVVGSRIHHQLGRLYLHQDRVEDAVGEFQTALRRSGRVETGLKQAAYLASAGHYCEALEQLDATAPLLDTDPAADTRHGYYAQELSRLGTLIAANAAAAGVDCRHPGSSSGSESSSGPAAPQSIGDPPRPAGRRPRST